MAFEKNMLWIKNTIYTSTEGIEPVSGILLMNGINGYEVLDGRDFEDFLENKEVYFDYIEDDLLKLKDCETTVTFYVPENAQGLETVLAVKSGLQRLKAERDDCGRLEMNSDTKLEEEDWENNWKKYFKPFSVGKNLVVKPTWEKYENGGNKTVIEIDPSSSFGTGSHTTTRLCLEKIEETLENCEKDEKEILDMGCGSGILGIAAIKLGAKHVRAVDIDENSARIAKENFQVNGISDDRYEVFAGNALEYGELYKVLKSRKYDIIAANIVADVIKMMAGLFKELLKEDGKLICSGIIAERADEVTKSLEKAGFKVCGFTEKEEWAVIVLCHGSL